MINFDRIKELYSLSTPGPWWVGDVWGPNEIESYPKCIAAVVLLHGSDDVSIGSFDMHQFKEPYGGWPPVKSVEEMKANAEFVVEAHNMFESMLEYNKELEKEILELRSILARG